MYYFTILSNFIYGFDKYNREYNKNKLPNTKFRKQFFLLNENELHIGFNKAKKILNSHGKENDKIICFKAKTNKKLYSDHETKLGQYIKSSKIKILDSYLVDELEENKFVLNKIRLEDLSSMSYFVNKSDKNIKDLKPRSISILPIAIGCQAKCSFCFSKYSVSTDIKNNQKYDFDLIENLLIKSKEQGVNRAVITGGGEPTLMKEKDLMKLLNLMSKHFKNTLMITNSYNYTILETKEEILNELRKLKQNGLSRIAISRHHYDLNKNTKIMNLEINSEKILEIYKEGNYLNEIPQIRLICVIQKDGINTKEEVLKYIEWGHNYGVKEFCFKELFVSSTIESEYSSYENNDLAYKNQVPLEIVIKACKKQKLKMNNKLIPWGVPVFYNDDYNVACYTEPSLGWELNHGICRSWNIMSDGKCLASLEHLDSEILI